MKKRCKWIEALSAIAAILTAGASIWTLKVNIVERGEVAALQKEAVVQKQTLSNALERVNLYGYILAAEGGDRNAYIAASSMLESGKSGGDSFFLSRKLREVNERFSVDDENAFLKEFLSWPSLTPIVKIGAMLKDKSALQRLYAIKKAYELRINSFMLSIFEVAMTDSDLRVVQLALYVINKTFEDNMIFNVGPRFVGTLDHCVLNPQTVREQFSRAWEVHKEKILNRKPKERRKGRDKKPPHQTIMYLFDPEKPDDIPVLKE